MDYPSIKQCLDWYAEQGTPENIIRHVKMVRRVAVFLATKLARKGIKIDLMAVDRASLLHDLDKWLTLNDKSKVHGIETQNILTRKGYPYLGFLARQHASDLKEGKYETWEEKLVSYADSRVLQDRIVSVKERYDYANIRYADIPQDKRENEYKYMLELEKEIFDEIKMEPDELWKTLN